MNHSDQCTAFVAAWEALRLKAYRDGAGIPTIGYGHIKGVQMGDTCTQEQALDWLSEELATASDDVDRLVVIPLEQHRFDALTSWVYNCGAGALATSNLLKCVNAALHDQAAVQMLRWNKAGGNVTRGLLARRAGEALMYALDDYTGT